MDVDRGDVRPGVPATDARHFVKAELQEGIKARCNRAFIRGLSRKAIAQTVLDALVAIGLVNPIPIDDYFRVTGVKRKRKKT